MRIVRKNVKTIVMSGVYLSMLINVRIYQSSKTRRNSLRISRLNVIMQSKVIEYFYLIEFDEIINMLISLS